MPPTDRRSGQAKGPAPAAAPAAWARVRLVRGQSAGTLWDVSSEIPEARIALGSGATVGWRVEAPGVQEMHVELFWDGSALWIADGLEGAGNVRVDGQHVDTWYALSGRARVEFGGAALLVETSLVADLSAAVDDAWRSSTTSPKSGGNDQKTTVHSPKARGTGAGDMNAAATQIAKPAQGTQSSYDIGATKLVSLPTDPRESFDEIDAEAMRLASPMQNLAPQQGKPRAGAQAQMQPGGFAATPGAQHPPPPRAAQSPGMGHAAAMAGMPALAPSPPPQQQPMVTMPGALAAPATVVEAPGMQGAPPGWSPSQSPPPPGAAKTGKKPALTLPLRTWLMIALVVAVLVVFVLDPEDEEVAPPRPRRQQTVQTTPGQARPGQPGQAVQAGLPIPNVPTQPGVPTPVVQPGQPVGIYPSVPPVPQPGQPVAQVQPVQPALPIIPAVPPEQPLPVPDPGGPAQPEVAPGADPAQPPVQQGPSPRLAADYYIAGRWRDALPLYEALAAQNPQNAAYAEIARILRRRLQERCRDGIGPGGLPCEMQGD